MSDDTDTADVDEEDQPEITEEETADVDLADLADDVEEATRPDVDDDQDDVDDQDDDVGDDQGDGLPAPDTGTSGQWGDMYVGLCTTVTNSIIDEYGDEGAEQVDEDHFREVDLDHYFNETLSEMGKSSDMPPQQALIVGTMLAVGGPVVMQTDLIGELLEGEA